MNIFTQRMRAAAVALLALASAGALAAADAVSGSTATLTLSQAIDVARRDNPEILAARKSRDAARARIRQAWTPNKPRIEIERMYAPRSDNPVTGADEKSVAVSQEIPFPTTLYYQGKAARREAEMADARYEERERDVLARVKRAYAMLYLSHHAIHIFEGNVALMRQFARVAESKYAVGKASQGDVLKAQVELSRTLNSLVTLEQERETSRAMLNALLNRDPDVPVGVPEEIDTPALAADLHRLTETAIDRRPELREAVANVARADAEVAASRSEFLPDLMLQYRRRSMPAADTHDAVVGFSIPVWFWKQGSMVREARAEREMARAELASRLNMTKFDVKDLMVKVQTAARLVELYRSSVLPQAEQALKVAEASYRSDKTGFLDLIDAARTYLDFQMEHYGHIAEYQSLVADLERVIGADLKETDL